MCGKVYQDPLTRWRNATHTGRETLPELEDHHVYESSHMSEEEVPLLERMEKGMLTEGVPAGIPRDKSEGEESKGGDHGLPSLLLEVRTSVL